MFSVFYYYSFLINYSFANHCTLFKFYTASHLFRNWGCVSTLSTRLFIIMHTGMSEGHSLGEELVDKQKSFLIG